ncbi:glycine cleavage T-protein/YgfZ, C-terminal domain-containing protein [Pisolithus tinctorius]|nr:glycine cleavage T-protein/YgfZ, C-terminal domain-containing protein [Pisolithus tinctorius]KAI6144042.1 glycine cleavage T-protein/YgfZ, C-terminal domain-containing protein [Pisolithus tinctorius]
MHILGLENLSDPTPRTCSCHVRVHGNKIDEEVERNEVRAHEVCIGLLPVATNTGTVNLERIGEAEVFTVKLRKTGLYDFHVLNGAKMMPFVGYAMPLSYGSVGQVASHNHVRTSAGLLDVGHSKGQEGMWYFIDNVRKHLKDGPPRRRVSLVVEEAPARHCPHTLIDPVEKVTSGIPSPTLNKNIAMGYVPSGWHKKGTEVEVDVRNKLRKAIVTPMPFIKPSWRG